MPGLALARADGGEGPSVRAWGKQLKPTAQVGPDAGAEDGAVRQSGDEPGILGVTEIDHIARCARLTETLDVIDPPVKLYIAQAVGRGNLDDDPDDFVGTENRVLVAVLHNQARKDDRSRGCVRHRIDTPWAGPRIPWAGQPVPGIARGSFDTEALQRTAPVLGFVHIEVGIKKVSSTQRISGGRPGRLILVIDPIDLGIACIAQAHGSISVGELLGKGTHDQRGRQAVDLYDAIRIPCNDQVGIGGQVNPRGKEVIHVAADPPAREVFRIRSAVVDFNELMDVAREVEHRVAREVKRGFLHRMVMDLVDEHLRPGGKERISEKGQEGQ